MKAFKLVIVESPTKAKTIRKFLPKDFIVEASVGHIRDLPQSAADIPAAIKDQEWTKLGVNIDADFAPLYIVPKGKTKVIQELKRKMKDAAELYLATDEDREGESISWHLTEVLKPKIPTKRMVFHEITAAAIKKSLQNTREIDLKLVRAQETRRILDRLVGYSLSPLIWKKIAYGLSAGRVQSAALRIIVDRERERILFKRATYWDLKAELDKGGERFEARLLSVDGVRVAGSKDFDERTGQLLPDSKVTLLTESDAKKLNESLKRESWKVVSVEERDVTSRPAPPFVTSSLQQEGNRKLGLSARETMRLAQSLYEEGLITYMRTDSPNLSQEALQAARGAVVELYGKEYLPAEPRNYSSKSKGAQEAHEAIRPAGSEFVHPDKAGLSGKAKELYELIWMRTVASQMVDAKKKSVSAKIQAGNAVFNATGTTIVFPGFIRAYYESTDDVAEAGQERVLPRLAQGDTPKLQELASLSHETQPPARYTEASLVRDLEKAGVGRPSTYASIISTLLDRDYARKNGNALIPTFTGFAVTQLMQRHFGQLVDLDFTSQMEKSLDEIAEGERQWLPYLKEFFLGKTGLIEQIATREKKIDPSESRTLDLPHLSGVEVKIGRYGAYVVKAKSAEELAADKKAAAQSKKSGAKSPKGKSLADTSEEIHASIPEDIPPADLNAEKVQEILELSAKGPQPIGIDPETKKNIYCLTGRFGPYVQLGEVTEEEPKPKRASVPKGFDPKTVQLAQALQWLSLPKELGKHPVKGEPVIANNGRFGPYVKCGDDFRSLKKDDNVYTVTFERAMELLNEPKKGRSTAQVIREMGPHPEDQKPIQLLEGKFGPYLKWKSVNASLPKDSKPEDLTIDQAVALLAERKAAGKKRR